MGHSKGTAPYNGEEGGDDVKSSWPLCPGQHTSYNARYSGLQNREVELIPESRAQFGLQSAIDCMKSESLVIADKYAAVNTFPGLVHTACHTMEAGSARSPRLSGA